MGIIAAAQVAPGFYDARESTQRVAKSIGEAARSGAWLVVFTESCIPGYPDWVWRVSPRSSSPSAEPFATFERRTHPARNQCARLDGFDGRSYLARMPGRGIS